MNQEKIGKFIAKIRKEKKLTQEELAEKLNVNSRTISRWETGSSIPDISMFTEISKVLDVSINDLMSGEIVKEEEYQDKFEENVVNVVVKNKKNKYSKIFGIIYIISIVLIIGFICYIKIPFKQEYDKSKMTVKLDVDYLQLRTTYNGTPKVLIRSNANKDKLIFIRFESTLYDMREKNGNIDHENYVDLTTDNYDYSYAIANVTAGTSGIIGTCKVYYTNVKFSKIANANEQELEKIMKNSVLVFED